MVLLKRLCRPGPIAVAALLALTLPGGPGPEAATGEVRQLAPGEAVERTLNVGEIHTYELRADKGQTVALLLDKHGVALLGTVLGPAGDKRLTFGSISRRQGAETVSFVTEASGTYRIELRTNFPPSAPGTYRVQITMHAASGEEKSRLALQSCRDRHWLDANGNFLVDEALQSIAGCMEAVGKKVEDAEPGAREIVETAKAEIDYLAGRWQWGEFVSEGYEDNLVAAYRVLAESAATADAATSFRMLQDVAEDLAVKAEHCRNSPRGLGADLNVQVSTLAGSREEKGWWVFYKLKIHRHTDKFNHRFPTPSSPTSQTLPAGNYWFWAAHSTAEEKGPDPRAMQVLRVIGKNVTTIDFALDVH